MKSSTGNAKKWFITTILLTVLGLILVGALVVTIDPFFHYHRPLPGFPYQIDNQTSQNPGMARHMDYDTVLIGSSMTVNFEADWFRDQYGENMIKLCYNGAFPKDVHNTMEQIDRGRKKVNKVYLGVDLKSYTGDTEETKYPIPEHLHNRNLLDDVKYIYNKDVILDYIVKPIIQREPATSMSSVYNSEWWMKDYYSKDYVITHMDRVEKNDTTFPADMFDEGLESNLEVNIIPSIKEHGDTKFIVFMPPYSILYWYEYMQNNQFEACIREYELFCEKMLKLENVELYFFPGQEDIVMNLDNYGDVGHYSQEINKYMCDCFGNGTCKMTQDNYQEMIAAWADMVKNFDYEGLLAEYPVE